MRKVPSSLSMAATKDVLNVIGTAAHAAATALSELEVTELLTAASSPWSGVTTVTAYKDGKRDTRDGQRYEVAWSEFGSVLADYAAQVVPKGEGLWFTPGLSATGGCCDRDIDGITQVGLDADGTGEWDTIRRVLDAAGIAHIVQRSSSHTPVLPKWHAHVPLVRPVAYDKPTWRRVYRHIVGWWSAAAGLAHSLTSDPPLYGFDRATDRLGQPWFPAARRGEDVPVPETVGRDGSALDLDRFLELTGFDPVGAEQQAIARAPRRQPWVAPRRTRVQAASVGPGTAEGLLANAFREAGMLGSVIRHGKWTAMCPWSRLHTSGAPFDSSTVIFAPYAGRDIGRFYCSHAHCMDKTLREVLAALPQAAVTRAQAVMRFGVPVSFVPSCIAGCAVGGRRP
jgi:hypothetical protein